MVLLEKTPHSVGVFGSTEIRDCIVALQTDASLTHKQSLAEHRHRCCVKVCFPTDLCFPLP